MNYFASLAEQQHSDKVFTIIEDTPATYAQTYAEVVDYCKGVNLSTGIPVLIFTNSLQKQLKAFLGLQAQKLMAIIAHYDLPQVVLLEMMQKNELVYILSDRQLGSEFELTASLSDGMKLYKLAGEGVALAEEICMGALSSGSTGVPKVLYRTYESWASFFTEQNRVFKITADSRLFIEGSLSFTGNLNLLADVLVTGASIVMTDIFRCRRWLGMIERYAVDVIYLVPAKLKVMARAIKQTQYPSVRMIFCGSQLLEAATGESLLKAMLNSELILYYGASELNYITYLTYQELKVHPQSVGKPFPKVEVTIHDEKIYVSSDCFVYGKTAPCTVNDTGYFDKDGYLIFGGRCDNIINKGGFKVNCFKVENIIKEYPSVIEAAVLGYTESGHGSEVAAFVAATGRLDKQSLRSFLKDRLSPQELPKQLIFCDNIPLNSLGKVDFKWLKKELVSV